MYSVVPQLGWRRICAGLGVSSKKRGSLKRKDGSTEGAIQHNEIRPTSFPFVPRLVASNVKIGFHDDLLIQRNDHRYALVSEWTAQDIIDGR